MDKDERLREAMKQVQIAANEVQQLIKGLPPHAPARDTLTLIWCDLCDAIGTSCFVQL